MTLVIACDICSRHIDPTTKHFYSAKVNNDCLTIEYFEYSKAKEAQNHICSKPCLANFVQVLGDEMVKKLQIILEEEKEK